MNSLVAQGGLTSDDIISKERPLLGGVLAHERGHAEIFFAETMRLFESYISDYLAKETLNNDEQAEVERLYEQARFDTYEASLQRANERTVFWHRENGFKVTRGGLTDDEPYGLSRRPYYFDY